MTRAAGLSRLDVGTWQQAFGGEKQEVCCSAKYRARNIFLCYVCVECRAEKLLAYRLGALLDPHYAGSEDYLTLSPSQQAPA
jgi:hypothetical protein